MKIHLQASKRAMYPRTTACGIYFVSQVQTTTDPVDVTCAYCLKAIAKTGTTK